MTWSSASSARGIATGIAKLIWKLSDRGTTAAYQKLARHTRADTVGTRGPSRADGTQGGASGREAPDGSRKGTETLRQRHNRSCEIGLSDEGSLFSRVRSSRNSERKMGCNRRSSTLQQKFVPARARGRKSPTRVLFCRLGPLDWSRLRCRTTVPQLVSRPDQRPRTAPASHTTRPPRAWTPICRSVPEARVVWIL